MDAPFDPAIYDFLVFDAGDETDDQRANARFWEPPLKHRPKRVARKR